MVGKQKESAGMHRLLHPAVAGGLPCLRALGRRSGGGARRLEGGRGGVLGQYVQIPPAVCGSIPVSSAQTWQYSRQKPSQALILAPFHQAAIRKDAYSLYSFLKSKAID